MESRLARAVLVALLVLLALAARAAPAAAQCQVARLGVPSLRAAIDGDRLAVGWVDGALALRYVDVYVLEAGGWLLPQELLQPGNPDGLYDGGRRALRGLLVAGAPEDYLGGQIFAGRAPSGAARDVRGSLQSRWMTEEAEPRSDEPPRSS